MRNSCEGNALVLDIGGGTTDICMLYCTRTDGVEVMPQIKSRYVCGISQLGGVDFTKLIVSRIMLDALRKKFGIDFSNEERGFSRSQIEENMRRMEEKAEEVKLALSITDVEECTVKLFFPGELVEREVSFTCKRNHYENIIKENIDILRKQLKVTVASQQLNLSAVSDLIITGGASVTPLVRKMAIALFKGTDCNIHYVDHNTAVSRGAAIYANELGVQSGCRQSLTETNFDIGTVNLAPFSGREVFTCLINCGTKFEGNNIVADFLCNLTEQEKEGRYCKVLLYRRPRDYTHVESPLDADGGDYIRPIGSLYVSKFPDEFDVNGGKVMFKISLDTQECIFSTVHFYNRTKKSFYGGTEDILISTGSAVFIPLNEKQE